MDDNTLVLQTDKTVGEAIEAADAVLEAGDVVKLAATATYYDGRIMPSWVKSDQWIVSRVDGKRVVIDKNVSGTHAICSPVHQKYLQKV